MCFIDILRNCGADLLHSHLFYMVLLLIGFVALGEDLEAYSKVAI